MPGSHSERSRWRSQCWPWGRGLAAGLSIYTGNRQAAIRGGFQVFLMILGAGNGYALALATGDLRRMLAGTAGGALLGLTAFPVLELPLAGFFFVCVMLAFLLIATESRAVPLWLGVCGAVFMLAVCFWAIMLGYDPQNREATPMFFGSTFVCSGIGVVTARPWSTENVFNRWIDCSAAAVLGIVCTLPLWVVFGAIDVHSLEAASIFFASCITVANYFFMRLVFNSIARPQPVASTL